MLSGLFVSNAQHLGWIISCAWFPLVIYCYVLFCRNSGYLWGLLFVVFYFLMLSGGYPAFFVITAYILFAIFGHHLYNALRNRLSIGKYLINNIVIAGAFILLSAVILTSSFELSHFLSRTEKFSDEFVQTFPLPFQGLLSFLFPYATTGNVNFFGSDFSLVNCYIGLIALIFLVYSLWIRNKKAAFLTILGLFFLSAALADVFPIRKILYYLPFMNTFRFPTVFRFFAYSCFIIASGYGLNHFFHHKQNRKFFYSLIIIASVVVLFMIYNILNSENWKYSLLLKLNLGEFDKIASIHERIVFQSVISLVLIGLLLLAWLKAPVKSFPAIVVCIVIIDMVASVQLNIYHTVIYKIDPRPTQAAMKNLPLGFPKPDLQTRIIDNSEESNSSIPGLWRNMNILYKKPTAEGYTPYYLKSRVEAEKADLYNPILNFPIVFLSENMSDGIIDTNQIDTLSHRKISITDFNPNLIEMKVRTDRPQLMTYMQNIYPGWHALVNGKKATILKSNYNFMSVNIPAGENVFKFEYKPKNIIVSFYISLITFIVILAAIVTYLVAGIRNKQKRLSGG